MSKKATCRASTIIYPIFTARTEENAPLLPASSLDSQKSGFHSDVPDLTDGEHVASILRPKQDILWDQEHKEREKNLELRGLLHHGVLIHAPLSNVSTSQKESVCFPSDGSDGTRPPEMYEQQTGIIREYVLRADNDKSEEEGCASDSDSSSLRRRGAVKRKTNPVFGRPTYKELDHLRGLW
jgi:hypothetical protein